MRIHLASIFVDDQAKALQFYTEVLGFQEKEHVPVGDYEWLTVVSPGEPNGTQLLLEPDAHPAVKPFKDALLDDGIPFTSFAVDDVARRVRAAQRPRGPVHPAADGPGACDDRRVRRHLWEPDLNRPPELIGAASGYPSSAAFTSSRNPNSPSTA